MLHVPKDAPQHVCGFAESSVGIAVVSGAAEDDRSAVSYLAEHEACGYGEPAGRVQG